MSLTFFTDRDLGKRFPDILRAAGLSVERHDDWFQHDSPDEQWLRKVARRDWVVVTHDRRIQYKPNELAAIVAGSLRLIVVVGAAPTGELAANFVATIHQLERFFAKHGGPVIARLYRPAPGRSDRSDRPQPGRVELSWPKS